MSSNDNKLKALITVALLGLGAAAQAQDSPDFVPVENLTAKERSFYVPQIKALEGIVTIDWGSVLAGVDRSGKLILRDRKTYEMQAVGEPSCWPTYTK